MAAPCLVCGRCLQFGSGHMPSLLRITTVITDQNQQTYLEILIQKISKQPSPETEQQGTKKNKRGKQ